MYSDDIFELEKNNIDNNSSLDYNFISGLGESDYENEDLFDTEVSTEQKQTKEDYNLENIKDVSQMETPVDYDFMADFNNFNNKNEAVIDIDTEKFAESNEINVEGSNLEEPIYNNELPEYRSEVPAETEESNYIDDNSTSIEEVSNVEESNLEEPIYNNELLEYPSEVPAETEESNYIDENSTGIEEVSNIEESNLEESVDNSELNEDESLISTDENKVVVDNEFLDNSKQFSNNLEENDYEIPVVEPTAITMSDTPIEELNKLTEYSQDKISTTDIKSLFDRVGVNVKEASDIFRKNTEMKEKIDTRFEELKKLQSEVEKAKQTQYDEINSYKEEVLSKLTEKKDEIEKRLNKLKDFQANLEKEREEFEKYKKAEKEEIERVQREVQEAYDSRREELNHIEDILRKQKDSLDEERNQLSLDRIQYESDKNELANNLLKFNEIVDAFTNGMDKINKE